jgi:mono/diheme cytochrome c family protein
LAVGAAVAMVVMVPLGAVAFIKSGIYDVAAFKPHTRFTWWVTNETMIHSVKRHAKTIVAPERFTPQQVAAGFCRYETHCVACHGAAGVAREDWVSGLEPQPPYLLDAPQRFTPRELFWIAQNGIKMTGMPSWRDSLSEPQMWDVVAWLEASTKLPPQTYVRWRSERRCGPPIAMPSPSRGWSAIPPRAPAPPTGATGG